MTHIDYQFLKIFYEKLKKLSKELITFSIFHKIFPKIVYKTHIYIYPKQQSCKVPLNLYYLLVPVNICR